jgi:hypothetical protein
VKREENLRKRLKAALKAASCVRKQHHILFYILNILNKIQSKTKTNMKIDDLYYI